MNKTFNISIKWITFLLLIYSNNALSQYFEYQKDNFLKNYETAYSNGKLDIGLPLFSVTTARKELKLNVGLSYNTDYVSGQSTKTELGLGWSLINGGGVISKHYIWGLNDNNHIYQYNFLGKIGRFYVKYDTVLNDIRAVESYPTTNKIVIMKTNDSIFSGFKIIDDNGLQYIFDKKNVSSRFEYPQVTAPPGHLGSNPTPKRYFYTSAFLLSKILDEKNNVLVDYEFITRSSGTDPSKSDIQNTVNKINIKNVGTVDYVYLGNTSSLNDGISLNQIILKNKGNQIASKYIIYPSDYLNEIIQKDKNDNEINRYQFTYYYPQPLQYFNEVKMDMYGFVNWIIPCHMDYPNFYRSTSINPELFNYGFLKSIKYPTGGMTEYEYEANIVPITPYIYHTGVESDLVNDLQEDFEVEKLADIDFDKLVAQLYPFSIANTQNYARFFVKVEHEFYDQTDNPRPNYLFSYRIERPGQSNDPLTLFDYKSSNVDCEFVKEFHPPNNNLVLRISGGPTHGKAQIFGVKKMSKNYRYAKGGRIKSVKTYNKNWSIPINVTKFEYNLFSNPSKSSAYLYDEFYEDLPEAEPKYSNGNPVKNDYQMIFYGNVKVTDSIKNTSVKYTYVTAKDVDSIYNLRNQDLETISYNQPIKKQSLIKNIEKYDAAGNLVEKTVNTNAIEYITQTGITDTFGNPLKILFIKSSLGNSQLRVENTTNMLHSSRENFFEPEHNLLTRALSTDFSGYTTEQKMYYPKDLNNQKLLNANLVSVPLRTELLEGGLLKGKAETKFDDPATVYPTSQIVYNMQTQQAQSSGSIEGYDDMGNVVEVKSKTGVSTVTIWGYYKTQPIAVITGATYAQVKDLPVITAAVNASNSDDDNPSTEPALIQALDNLRKDNALKNYQITTYTYDPLIGLTSTTLPSGMREINIYDNANRLLKVTDINGKTLKEFKYHYQNQQ